MPVKATILMVLSLALCSFGFANQGSVKTLSDLKGLEGGVESDNQRTHSPSQVVILNNTPNSLQAQNMESEMKMEQTAKQKTAARQGWGTGESLDDLRGERNRQEAKNEQTLMEKLEESRMEDEKSRLRRLFKIRQYNQRRSQEMSETGWGSSESNEMMVENEFEYAPQKVAQQAPVVNVIVPDSAVKADVALNSSATATSTERVSTRSKGDLYLKGMIGLGDYRAAENATGVSSWGVSVGKQLDTKLSFEIGLFRTAYEVNDPNAAAYLNDNLRDLTQYNLTGALGYKLMQRDQFGLNLRAGLSYVRRDSDSANYPGAQRVRSNTIDGLIGAEADVEIAQNISVTAGLDYYTNLINDIASTNSEIADRVEKRDYFVFGVGLKLNF